MKLTTVCLFSFNRGDNFKGVNRVSYFANNGQDLLVTPLKLEQNPHVLEYRLSALRFFSAQKSPAKKNCHETARKMLAARFVPQTCLRLQNLKQPQLVGGFNPFEKY